MKATEIMVGDFVTFAECLSDDEITVIEITGVDAFDEAIGKIDHADCNDALGLDELAGFPLTEEILKKNGFGYIERDAFMGISHYYLGEPQYCRNMDLHIGTDNNGLFWLNYLRNDIYGLRYVHELQHAFRLLRIDREVVL